MNSVSSLSISWPVKPCSLQKAGICCATLSQLSSRQYPIQGDQMYKLGNLIIWLRPKEGHLDDLVLLHAINSLQQPVQLPTPASTHIPTGMEWLHSIPARMEWLSHSDWNSFHSVEM